MRRGKRKERTLVALEDVLEVLQELGNTGAAEVLSTFQRGLLLVLVVEAASNWVVDVVCLLPSYRRKSTLELGHNQPKPTGPSTHIHLRQENHDIPHY